MFGLGYGRISTLLNGSGFEYGRIISVPFAPLALVSGFGLLAALLTAAIFFTVLVDAVLVVHPAAAPWKSHRSAVVAIRDGNREFVFQSQAWSWTGRQQMSHTPYALVNIHTRAIAGPISSLDLAG